MVDDTQNWTVWRTRLAAIFICTNIKIKLVSVVLEVHLLGLKRGIIDTRLVQCRRQKSSFGQNLYSFFPSKEESRDGNKGFIHG